MSLAALSAAPASAQFAFGAADPLPDARGVIHCPLSPDVLDASWPAGVPPALVAELDRIYGPYAGPGEPYDALGERSGPSRRIMFVRHKGPQWVVAYEDGATSAGARSVHLLLYRIEPSGEAKRLDALVSFDGLLCRSSTALLARFPAG